MTVNLYWWRGDESGKNFGDELSKYTAEFAAGGEVSWKPRDKCNLFAIGSILGAARQCAKNSPDRSIQVWGTGLMSPTRFPGPLDNMKISAVRGPLTRSALGGAFIQIPMGDPGLLIDRVFDIKPQPKKYSVGIIPHFKHRGEEAFETLHSQIPDSVMIDVGLHPEEVANLIAQCECTISTSLHGLVVSDALSVPNVWVELTLLHAGGRFKFYDYFLGVKRPVFEPVFLDQLVKAPAATRDLAMSFNYDYHLGLEKIKDDIAASFPQELKQGQ